jgi:NAD+ diphosphatase
VLDGKQKVSVGFVGGRLDRADRLRADAALLAEAFAHPQARLVLLAALDPVVKGSSLVTEPLPKYRDEERLGLLGFDDEGPLFVQLEEEGLPHGAQQSPIGRRAMAMLTPEALAHYGAARSLVDWHARHGFCAQCGGVTRPVRAGWSRRCGSCRAEHFPRVDPVVIMLAEHDGRVLVGRQPRFPEGRYSALAGFIEVGETIEEAVTRELWEEAGVRATRVRYVMSQPWPFPSSLMIACIAEVEDDRLTLDETELEHAMWVDRDGIAAALEAREGAPFAFPPSMAVAYHLLRYWVDEVLP